MPTSSNKEQGEENLISLECQKLLLSLPREKGWRTPYIYKFQGFWCQPKQIQAILAFQAHFQVKDTDVIVATIPKSGTTWLKALVFAITNRNRLQCPSDHPLLVSNPHDLVPFFEYKVYASSNPLDVDLSGLSDPRLFATHIPFRALQESIRKSGCKIVYVCRNPFDTEAFEMYCKGVVGYGPFWEHMLGYWNESQERPEKVLFFKYEDMKEDVGSHVRKLAEFLGCPFSKGEEEEGLVGEIARLCSFEKLKELEVNKVGKKGEVGDWVNHLSPWMVDKLAQVMDEKLGGSGLKFKTFNS
ncbi:Cytosolic sulfotransferase 15 [Linum perenne]